MRNIVSGRQPEMTRRSFLGRSTSVLAIAALADLLGRDGFAQAVSEDGSPSLPNFAAKAKRVIYLFQSGGPSNLDLFDYKPLLEKVAGTDLPESLRKAYRQTTMTSTQLTFPVVPSVFKFAQYGQSGAWISELLPHHTKIVDDVCFIRSLHTPHVNHDPAVTFMQTGFQLGGRPSLGSWVSYGLGTENQDLPAFVVMVSGTEGQPLYDRLWGAGFIPSRYQGVKLRSVADRVLYLADPAGFERDDRRSFLDDLGKLNQETLNESNDPEINTRIAQYEMAFRMQASVPDLADLSDEPSSTFELYGEDARKPGTFASNCLMARRLAERNVRFIQLYHRDWDHHIGLRGRIPVQAKEVDQASAALIQDLKQRGLLHDTLVIWGGEFGRTVYVQGNVTADYGRDHHGGAFTIWMAGAGIKPGTTYGETDEYGYSITNTPVEVHDLNATILHQLGVDHTRLTYRYQGRYFRLTDVAGKVLQEILT